MATKVDKPIVFSALEVANICGVVNQTAINWIRSGYLKAFKTPGGQFRVYPDDLAHFMKNRNMRIPQELLDACSKKSFYNLNNILIIDDDKPLNNVIAKFIQTKFKNLNIAQAFDGFEAGVLMVQKRPQCFILDLNLPGVNGFELCKRIFESKELDNPIVIVITALEDSTIEQGLLDLGVKHFFQKPIKLDELANILSSYC